MRMRKKHNLDERISVCSDICLGWIQDRNMENRGENPTQLIDAEKIFGNKNPLWLEIGCGKGGFVQQMALKNPDKNFIAVEMCRNVLVTAMETTDREKCPNLRYVIGMAEYLEKLIPAHSAERIFLNFSCPYPKATYVKHRLTHKCFLDIYRRLLKSGGEIHQKTDNMQLFEFSLLSFSQNDFVIKSVSLDLHNSTLVGNINTAVTEYERMFSEKGCPIYYLEAVCRENIDNSMKK